MINAQRKLYREKNKDRLREMNKRWELKNPLKVKFKRCSERAAKRGKEFSLQFQEFSDLLNGAKCNYCGTEKELGLDRVVNSIGYHISNVVPCCRECNRLKYIYSRERFIKICVAVTKFQGNL